MVSCQVNCRLTELTDLQFLIAPIMAHRENKDKHNRGHCLHLQRTKKGPAFVRLSPGITGRLRRTVSSPNKL